MGHSRGLFLLMISILLVSVGVASSQTAPPYVSYQGQLSNASGEPVSGTYTMRFTIYGSEYGIDTLWMEWHSVEVQNGLFTVLLGNGVPKAPLDFSFFDSPDRWLGIKVGDDIEITPRTRLSSTPYSYRVGSVSGAVGGTILGSLSIEPYVKGANDSNGDLIVLGKIGAGTATPQAKLDVNGDAVVNGRLNVLRMLNSSSEQLATRAEIHNTAFGTVVAGVFYAGGDGGGDCFGILGTAIGQGPLNSAKIGVSGQAYGDGGNPKGVSGHGAINSGGNGDASGVYASSANNGSGSAFGVLAQSQGSPTGEAYGGHFSAGPSTGTGLHYGIFASAVGAGTLYAGYFSGDVNVTGTLTKGAGAFKIDHPLDPENKYLQHSFVESPDMMNIYNGNVITDSNGDAAVNLPSYFDALNQEFRYQLTVIGQFSQAIGAQKIIGNQFSIKTDKPNVEVSWQVTGIRKDAWATNHRIQVEIDKRPDERGLYLHPGVYNMPAERGIDFKHLLPDRLTPSQQDGK